MIEHDETVGTILKALDEMGIADNTIVVYSTDNGPHMNIWPDGAMTRSARKRIRTGKRAFRVARLARARGRPEEFLWQSSLQRG